MPGEIISERARTEETNPMADMLDQYLQCQELSHGEITTGTVVKASDKSVVVDIGAKCEGIVPADDLSQLSEEEREPIQVGNDVAVYVVTPEDEDGNIILSIARAQIVEDWRKAQELLGTGDTFERSITDCNKGGVIVNFGRIRGFVPGSQLDVARTAAYDANQDGRDRWSALLGETLELKVIEVDQERNRLILSEKAAVRERREEQREQLMKELSEGDHRRGRVVNLVDFGAFVDLGGVDGLIHLSELSWKRVSHPREVLKVGQEVEVYVLSVDHQRERIGLSLKRMRNDPWSTAAKRYQDGQLIEGVITNLTKWGAFARIKGDEAIEGLIHISELDDRHISHPNEVVQPGDTVTLRVLSLDTNRHRLSLSLKQVTADEYKEQDWESAITADQSEGQSSISAAFSEAMESDG